MIVTVLFALSAATSICAQGGGKEGVAADLSPCFASRIGDRELRWFRHELAIISICIPETLVRRRTQRCGDKCYIFETDEFYFDLDPTTAAWRPTFEKKYPSFSVVNKSIDGKPSNIWNFEDTGKYKYVAGVNVILERGQIGLGVYLFSKSSDPKPIADRMFNSIKFVTSDRK